MMQSSLIGKIEKAKRYAQEKERVKFDDFAIHFHGDNSEHIIQYKDGKWRCTCNFFESWGLCSHTMAIQKILGEMLPDEAYAANSEHGVILT